MSPEQAAGERHLDGRSDIYSLACLVYEMLAGEPPFTGPTPQAVIAKRFGGPPTSLHVLRQGIPEGVSVPSTTRSQRRRQTDSVLPFSSPPHCLRLQTPS